MGKFCIVRFEVYIGGFVFVRRVLGLGGVVREFLSMFLVYREGESSSRSGSKKIRKVVERVI